METFSAFLAICAGNSTVSGEFPAQRPVTQSFDVFFDLRPNKRLSKHWWGRCFETPSCPLWRHCDENDLTGELKEPQNNLVSKLNTYVFNLETRLFCGSFSSPVRSFSSQYRGHAGRLQSVTSNYPRGTRCCHHCPGYHKTEYYRHDEEIPTMRIRFAFVILVSIKLWLKPDFYDITMMSGIHPIKYWDRDKMTTIL